MIIRAFLSSLLLVLASSSALHAQKAVTLTDPLMIRGESLSLNAVDTTDILFIAQNESVTIEEPMQTTPEYHYRGSVFSEKNIHRFLGLGAIALGILAGGILPDDDDETSGTHHNLAVGATALGITAVGSGFLFYSNTIDIDDGISDTYNLHALSGLIGTLGYMASVSSAPGGSHAGKGLAGILCLSAAVVIVW